MYKIPENLLNTAKASNILLIKKTWLKLSLSEQFQIVKIYQETIINFQFIELSDSILGEQSILDEDELFLNDIRKRSEYIVSQNSPIFIVPRTIVIFGPIF